MSRVMGGITSRLQTALKIYKEYIINYERWPLHPTKWIAKNMLGCNFIQKQNDLYNKASSAGLSYWKYR